MSYYQDAAVVRTRLQWCCLFAFLILVVVLPFLVSNYALTVFTYMAIGIVSALGLNLLTGYAGQISVGHAAFMGVGGFAAAHLSSGLGLPFWLAVPAGGVAAGLVGLVFGIPSLRVKGLYLALTTLAAQFILFFVFVRFIGGDRGIMVERPQLAGFSFSSSLSY